MCALSLTLVPAACLVVETDEGGEETSGGSAIVAASLQYGFCGGSCKTVIVIEGAELVATLRSRQDLTLLENRGRLTARARDDLDEIAADLADRELRPRYGCPGCADGGISSFELRVGDDVSAHQYDHERPPEVLAPLNKMVDDIVDALSTCQSSPRVRVTSCTPR